MARRPRLWRHVAVPVALNLVATVLLIWGLLEWAPEFMEWLKGNFDAGAAGTVLLWLTTFGAGLLALGTVLGIWVLLQAVLCAWFYVNLAHDMELELGMKESEIQDPPMIKETIETMIAMAKVGAISIICLLLGFIPFLTPFAVAAAIYLNAMVLATDYWSYPLSLRGLSFDDRRKFSAQHRATSLGMGTSVMALSWIPIINSVLLSSAVAGAVLLQRRVS